MKRVAVNDLKVNTYFDAPLYLEDEEYLILSPDIPVTLELINRLKAWNYREVLTEGSAAGGPQNPASELPAVAATGGEESLEEREGRGRAAAFFTQLVKQTEAIYSRLIEGNTLDGKAAADRVKEIADMGRDNHDQLLACLAAPPAPAGGSYLAGQCAGTAVLALALGVYLKLPSHRLIELGTAALLHKVGMAKLPIVVLPERKGLRRQGAKGAVRSPYRGLPAAQRALRQREHRAGGGGAPGTVRRQRLSPRAQRRRDFRLLQDHVGGEFVRRHDVSRAPIARRSTGTTPSPSCCGRAAPLTMSRSSRPWFTRFRSTPSGCTCCSTTASGVSCTASTRTTRGARSSSP